MRVTVKVENDYSDGHHSEREVELVIDLVEYPDAVGLERWFEEVAYQETGDGHGLNRDLGSCYTVTIIAAPDPTLVGEEYEWVD